MGFRFQSRFRQALHGEKKLDVTVFARGQLARVIVGSAKGVQHTWQW